MSSSERPAESLRVWLPVAVATALVVAGVLLSSARPPPGRHAAAAPPGGCASLDQSHVAWTEILGRYVHDGFVDYALLKASGAASLAAYRVELEAVCPDDYRAFGTAQKIAFLVDAYNLHALLLILDHYPVESIRDIGLLPMAAFRDDFIHLRALSDDALSLNDLESALRDLGDPRIHFTIVCASKSCPMLRSEAYRGADLDRQLDDAARRFIGDASKNHFDAGENTLYLSSIFKWYRKDFEHAAGSIPAFLAHYVDPSTAAWIKSPGARIELLDYDWSLNGR